jgi:hypothetical protein
MQDTRKYQVLGIIFLILGIVALSLAIVNRTVIYGTGICFALAFMMFTRARQGRGK